MSIFVSQHSAEILEEAASAVAGVTTGLYPSTLVSSLIDTDTLPAWRAGGPIHISRANLRSSLAYSVGDLTNTTLTDETDGEILVLDTGSWVNKTLAEAGVATASALAAHEADVANPHAVTKSQVGLANVENVALSTWGGSASVVVVGEVAVTTHEAALSITESQISDLQNYSLVGHAHAASDTTSGTFADARIAASSVTQHQAALSITESQISDLQSYTLVGHTHAHTDITDFDAEVNALVDARLDTTQTVTGAWTIGAVWTLSQQAFIHAGLGFQHETGDPFAGNAGYTRVYANSGDSLKYRDGTGTIYQMASRAWVDAHEWDATDLTSGTLADARVAASNVTQHQAALSITESQISDLQNYSLVGHTHTASSVSDFSEAVDARVSGLIQDGVGITWTYLDISNTLTPAITLSPFDTDDLGEGVSNLYFTNARVDSRITSTWRGIADGLASLDATGKIPSSQLPAIALTTSSVVANETAQLALTAEEGDVAIRTDENKSYIHNGGTAGTMADWDELLTPTDTVLSVNGQTGAVTLTTSDITEGSNLYYTQARFDTAFGLKDTDDLTEGSTNLYYTDTRVDTRLDQNLNIGGIWSHLAAVRFNAGIRLQHESGAPNDQTGYTTLWVDDADANRLKTVDGDTSTGKSLAFTDDTWDTTAITTGTFADARIAASNVTQHQAALSITESQISDFGSYANVTHTHAASDITSGTLADARVAQSNVTQHQAALSITESQISDLQSYSLTSHNHTLDSLSNVTITSVASGEIIKWSGSAWINNTLAEAGVSAVGHVHSTADITSGTLADALVAQSNVTQHQAALSITESQISDFGSYASADAFNGLNNGLSREEPSLTIGDNGSIIYVDIEADGGGDIDFIFNNVLHTLDCTTGSGASGKARATLTAGASASSPQKNWVYVVDGGSVATIATSTSKPTGEYAMIAVVVVPDLTTFQTTGAYSFQLWVDTVKRLGRGAVAHHREREREQGVVWMSGVAPTTSITPGSPDTVHFTTTSGTVLRLHEHTFPAFSTGPYHVYNDSTTAYTRVTDLSSLLTDANGDSMSGKRFNLVFWGVMSHATGECRMFVNLPTGSYNSDDLAEQDPDATAVYDVDDGMRNVAFLIARVTLKHETSGGGDWTELAVTDLRGTPIGASAGGASTASSTQFTDDVFSLLDNTDNTKIARFEVSGVTTGTTRVVTIPDSDGTIAYTGHTHSASDLASGTLADARVAASNVTQHQAALTITESQISDLGNYADKDVAETIGSAWTFSNKITANSEILAKNGIRFQQESSPVTYQNNYTTVYVYDTDDTHLRLIDGSTGTEKVLANSDDTWDASAIASGTLADARVAETNITQHEGALSITESQISDLQAYLTSVALNDVTDVTITTPISGHILRHNGTIWVNNTLADAGVSAVGHTHAASDTTSGTFADARIAASNVTQHQAALSIAWSQLTSVPSTFTPSAHTHTASEITDFDTAVETWLDGARTINNSWVFTGDVTANRFVQSGSTSNTMYSIELSRSGTGTTSPDLYGKAGSEGVLIGSDSSTPGLYVAGTYVDSILALRVGGTERISASGALSNVTADASILTAGTLADARVAQSNVTQHQAALSITSSQVSDFDTAVDARIDAIQSVAGAWTFDNTVTFDSAVRFNGSGARLQQEASGPGGASGYTSLYALTDGNVYMKSGTGTEYGILSENLSSVSGWGFVLDEDDMVSDSATKLATQQSIKAYVQSQIVGGMKYIGGYNATTNTPDLDVSPSGIKQGHVYVVTTAGTAFFTATLEVGDMLFAEQDNPTLESHWTVLNTNVEQSYLLDRTNHTGTQLSTTISDFSTAVDTRLDTAQSISAQWTMEAGINVGDANTVLTQSTSNTLRITTAYGYGDFGPQNANWFHIETDRSKFYFNKGGAITGTFYPYTDSAYELGTTTNRWSNIWGDAMTIGGAVSVGSINEAAVTAHEGALTITESQISDIGAHTHSWSDLSDSVGTPVSGHVILHNGSAWVSTTRAGAGLSELGHTHSASDLASGTLADARVAQSNVTQHEAALSITESQISDLQAYLTSVSVGGISDVTLTSPVNGDILRYNGSIWVNNTLAGAGIAAASHTHSASDLASGTLADARVAQSNVTQHQAALSITESQISDLQSYSLTSHNHTFNSLSNVTITSVASGEIVKWSGSAWINNTLAEAGVSAVGHTHSASDLASGTLADARVAQSNVTQHQASLSITESQISDLGSYLENIVEDTSPQLGGNLDLNEFGIDLGVNPTSDHTAIGVKKTLTAGEALVFGDVVYAKSDGKMWKADADGVATMPIRAMAIATISADATGAFLIEGVARDDSWAFTVGQSLYGSTTAGGVVGTVPSGTADIVQPIGWANTATVIYFRPGDIFLERK